MDELENFMNEFDLLLKKYSIDDVILVDFDDGKMGYRQLVKFTKTEDRKFLVLTFSGKGETLCPCCAGEKEDCNE